MSTQVKLLLAATLVLGLLTGFAAGRGTAPATGQSEVLRELASQRALLEENLARTAHGPPPEVRCAAAPPTGSAVDAAWLRAELARVLREELGTPRPGHPEAEPKPPAEPPERSVAALQEGHRLLDEAIRARHWTDEDARALRRTLADMTDAQREELMRRLAVTLNGNSLDVQTQGAPF